MYIENNKRVLLSSEDCEKIADVISMLRYRDCSDVESCSDCLIRSCCFNVPELLEDMLKHVKII